MTQQQERVRGIIHRLKENMLLPIEIDAKFDFIDNAPYKKDNTFPIDGWKPLNKNYRFGGLDVHFWIKGVFKTPSAPDVHKRLILSVTTGREGQWDAMNPQGLVYLNSEMVQGLDVNHTEIPLECGKEYTMYIYFYTGTKSPEPFPVNMHFGFIDARAEKYYYDIKVPYEVCNMLDTGDYNYINMMSVLERSFNILDMTEIGSEQNLESYAAASEFLEEEFYAKLCSRENKPVVNCLGHTHIDIEWMWTRYQTREKIQRSFSTAAALMKEYPEYKFMLSQPELYRYLKEEAPEKYEELKKLVKQGRWEPEGSMYVEADCNLISGESMVRQILFGKRFFKDEFGTECKTLFLPDVFGYSAALPQILKKCGIDHFVTSKISWNDTNTMPVDTFMWEGIDGSEIFTNFITTQDFKNPPERNTTYVGQLTPSHIKGTWNRYRNKNCNNRTLTTFGHGDGGGGPTREMLETYKRLERGIPTMPVVESEFLVPHLNKVRAQFDENCKKNKNLPKWVGELYLEFHRGTYTSVAKVKRANRKSEFALAACEALSYTDAHFGGEYDKESINKLWRKVLHNQFHDIIPGSSINEVYDLTDIDYKQIDGLSGEIIANKLQSLADGVSADSGILVYNPTGFERCDTVNIDGKTYELSNPIPPFGWGVVSEFNTDCNVKIDGLTAENKYYKLTLNQNGSIKELYDKRACREVFKQGKAGNEILVYEDLPFHYDNWELKEYYKEKVWNICDEADISPIFDGTRAGFKVKIKYRHSTLCQNIWLYSENERIDFETEADWHEHNQVLKASMPFNVRTVNETAEIQYGHVNRSTHRNTSWDKARFEVYAHKWVDIADNGYGVAVLNDCKYGHSILGSELELTMLKCGTYPNKEADQGEHKFTYSLLPHTDSLFNAKVINKAYELNQPLKAVSVTDTKGSLPNTFSLVSTDKENLMLETVKMAEDGDSMIVRLYEAHNKSTVAQITVPKDFKSAYLCDLLEGNEQPVSLIDGKVELHVSNFEIVTLKFKK